MDTNPLTAAWLTLAVADLLPWHVMVILEAASWPVLAICGFRVAMQRKHAGSGIFMAGCGLLAATGLYEAFATLLFLLEIEAEDLFTSSLALELWRAVYSALFLFEAAGIGLLIWGTWRCLHDAETAGDHVRSASHLT